MQCLQLLVIRRGWKLPGTRRQLDDPGVRNLACAAATKPAAAKSAAAQPAPAKSTAAQPATSEPATSKSAPAQPASGASDGNCERH